MIAHCPKCGWRRPTNQTDPAKIRVTCPKGGRCAVEIDGSTAPPKKTPCLGCRQPSPSTLALGWNLAAFSARWTKKGFQTASAELYEARRAACESCPLYDPNLGRCTDCGCFIRLKAALLADGRADCPQSLWPDP